MQRLIIQQFRNNLLSARSELIDLKHIGPYLYRSLKREFSPRTLTLTIQSFARKIQNMTIDNLKRKLQKALQNEHNNQCVRIDGYDMYHVPDINAKGYEVIISLIKVLARNRDGNNIGGNFIFDASQLRMPNKRSTISERVSCFSRNQCRGNGGIWYDGLCQPPAEATGFAGVHPYSGQKTNNRSPRSPLGSNSVRRGRYARSPNGKVEWRRPGRMAKV